MEEELKNKIKKGFKWVFVSQLINQVVFVWFAIYLARILDPSVFGMVGLITVFTNYATFFVDMGLGTALIQRKDLDQDHLSSIFWFNLMLGILLCGLVFVAAPWLAAFYGEPRLVEVTRVISLSFVITSLSVVQGSLLDKQLDFKKKVTLNWIATIIGYLIGIGMALFHFGVWSLVAQLISTQIVNSVLLWTHSSWYPSMRFSMAKIREISGFGLNVLGDTSINYWSRNADNFLIGKFIGSQALGLYSRAYSLMLLPIRNVSSVVSRVMFPAFSSIQGDRALIRSIYLRTIRYIAYITFPSMVGLCVVTREFVMVCFGEKWVGMIPILQWLSILGAFQSILNLNGMIYNSVGKPHIAFRVSIVVSLVYLSSFVIGLATGGLMGITIAYFIAGTGLSIPIYFIAIKQISVTLKEVAHVISGSAIGSVVLAAVVLVYKHFQTSVDNLLVLSVSVGLGIVTYALALLLVDDEFKRIAKQYLFRNG